MNKDTIYRTLRLIGAICSVFLAVIGALGIDVPALQELFPASVGAVIIAVISEISNHWYNNNYTIGAKCAQPEIHEYNTFRKVEGSTMGKGSEDDE